MTSRFGGASTLCSARPACVWRPSPRLRSTYAWTDRRLPSVSSSISKCLGWMDCNSNSGSALPATYSPSSCLPRTAQPPPASRLCARGQWPSFRSRATARSYWRRLNRPGYEGVREGAVTRGTGLRSPLGSASCHAANGYQVERISEVDVGRRRPEITGEHGSCPESPDAVHRTGSWQRAFFLSSGKTGRSGSGSNLHQAGERLDYDFFLGICHRRLIPLGGWPGIPGQRPVPSSVPG